MLDSLRGWIAAYNSGSSTDGKGYIYRTTNGGNSWVQEWITPIVGTDLQDLSNQNNMTLWCVGNNGQITKYDVPTGISKNTEVVKDFNLSQNYPNPFNPTTNIKYQITNNKLVTLKIFDILGKEVETLVNEKQNAGTYEVTFNASQYSSGIYFYKLTTDNFSDTKKMLMIK
jgi:hypothetical protein